MDARGKTTGHLSNSVITPSVGPPRIDRAARGTVLGYSLVSVSGDCIDPMRIAAVAGERERIAADRRPSERTACGTNRLESRHRFG